MNATISPRDRLIRTIVDWGHSTPDVKALALVGSGARGDRPADQWSDIDLILVTSDLDRYRLTSDWLQAIGELWVITVERNPQGQVVEQRVLFRNGIDVDWIPLSCDRVEALCEEPLCSIIRGGLRVLFDKTSFFPAFPVEERKAGPFCPPSPAEFAEVVNDFWFHTVWTAKKIRRGELWTAKSCCDVYMKRLLLTVIEWHARATGGVEQKTWYNGRFIEQWSGPRVLARLPEIFAHYEEEDLWQALENTMTLFDELASETAQRWALPYPNDEARSIIKYVHDRLVFPTT